MTTCRITIFSLLSYAVCYSLKQGLFFNYKIESTFSISNHIKDSRKEVVGKILTTVFLLSMVILGVFLGRKWHEIRKNQSNSKI